MAKLKWITRSAQFIQGNAGATMYERYVTVAGANTINTVASFAPGSHQLNVYRNGVYQEVGIHYVELGSNQIRFTQNFSAGESILLTIQGVYSQRLHEEYVATANQTRFSLSGTYHVGLSTLLVFRNGMLQRNGVDYAETDQQTVTLTTACKAGEIIIFHEQL